MNGFVPLFFITSWPNLERYLTGGSGRTDRDHSIQDFANVIDSTISGWSSETASAPSNKPEAYRFQVREPSYSRRHNRKMPGERTAHADQ